VKRVYVCDFTSKGLSAADYALIMEACKQQLVNDFAHSIGTDPADVVEMVGALPDDTEETEYVLTLFRDSTPDDPQGALAYHWENDEGRPQVDILVDTILSQPNATRDDVCIAAGHEFCETEGDEFADDWSDRGDGKEEPKEFCDRVQGYSYPKTITDAQGQAHTLQCTDFLLHEAFNNTPPAGAKFDFMGKLSSPREIGAGGYTVTRTAGTDETQVMGDVKAALAYSHKTLEKHGIDTAALRATYLK